MKPELNSLKQRIQNLLSSPGYRPMRVSEIVGSLKLPPSERGQVRRIMDHLLQQGSVVHVRKDRIVLPSEANLVTGRLQMNERGFGFVIPESPDPAAKASPDIFIPAEDTGVAMHGDRVLVRVNQQPPARRKGRVPERASDKISGCIIRVLERANTTLVGVLQRSPHFHFVRPDDPRIQRDVYVNLSHGTLKPRVDDRVVVKLQPWENRQMNPEGIISEVIGRSDDPSLDILVIVKKFKFRVDFPPEVIAHAEAIEETVPEAERMRRMDFTQDMVVTIDPDDARDYDDALSLKRTGNGRWLLGVHIADVSHYVKPGSALDREARERGNSVYLPDRVIPMLPQHLSNGICSLKGGVERLTQTVLFELNPDCTVHSRTFHDSIICSSARLTYKQALSVIKPQAGSKPLVDNPAVCRLLQDLWSVASRVRALRFANGSLDLDFPELKVHCNERGLAERIEKQENDISHQLVEEFMLMANEAVAAETRRRTMPSIYRVHDEPDVDKLEQYRDFVIANGFTMGDPSVRGEIQKLLKRLAGKPEEYILKLNLLRSLKRAQYSTTPVGHFGLSKENYTHFTSPIRRYADLIIHRSLIRATKHSRKPLPHARDAAYDSATLDTICNHCSITERVADEAEKEAVKLKLIEYFENQLRKHKLETFDALVTEVRNFGLFIELPDYMLSGLIHISTLGDDFYHFDAARQKFTGKKTKRVIQPGQRLKVKVSRVDRFKKQVDFALAD